MKWEPINIIRLVALIGAMLLFAIGVVMIWQGISAEGAIDIKSSFLSGSVKTGSAGLFIAFLSFAIIAFVLLSLGKQQEPQVSIPLTNRKHSAWLRYFGVC
jgi:hypothetical protein